jgi:hypothetical protein
MRLLNLLTLAAAALLAPAAIACKCKTGAGHNVISTSQSCCSLASAEWDIDDCKWSSMGPGEQNIFNGCCQRAGLVSDC